MSIDLHCHSTISDGAYAPDVLAQKAHQNGASMWALTDHDEIAGLSLARETANRLGMQFINGVEISTVFMGVTVHIVGLHFDDQDSGLVDFLNDLRQKRIARAKAMALCFDRLGIPNTFEGALLFSEGREDVLGRVHFARYLHQIGLVSTIQEAFDRYLSDGNIAYVPGQWATVPEAVACIREAGGVAVLAHLGRYKYTPLQQTELLISFKKSGGQAIEVVTGSHKPEQYNQYAKIAMDWGFYASCGSDYHGLKTHEMMVGRVPRLPSNLNPVWKLWHD